MSEGRGGKREEREGKRKGRTNLDDPLVSTRLPLESSTSGDGVPDRRERRDSDLGLNESLEFGSEVSHFLCGIEHEKEGRVSDENKNEEEREGNRRRTISLLIVVQNSLNRVKDLHEELLGPFGFED